mmetsp:Transcript_7001/g.9409  ORF Transcript_7001/g.9409 Transcript_7001/m.9409 type:complete len:493 (-) Transcript_7001:22-1500(-)
MHSWKVIIFGQTPYPRVESATGIAMFDNTFDNWDSKRFSVVTSMRTIMKAACNWEFGVDHSRSVSDVRGILKQSKVVQPPEWFTAMLAQGILLMNAGLTTHCNEAGSQRSSVPTSKHTKFWRPVIEEVVRAILSAKADKIKENEKKKKKKTEDDTAGGIVFAWWGAHAKPIKKIVDKLSAQYPTVQVSHIEHCNPAAQGDVFSSGNHFKDLNDELEELGMHGVQWLPRVGWDTKATKDDGKKKVSQSSQKASQQMKAFIEKTQELHKSFLERLEGAKHEQMVEMDPIRGISDLPIPTFAKAMEKVSQVIRGLDAYVSVAKTVAQTLTSPAGLTVDERAALYIYTQECDFYRKMNAFLREGEKKKLSSLFLYLRLFFSALSKLPPFGQKLYRGVAKDLRKFYKQGSTVTWWGVSSCTSAQSVAEGFMGNSGVRLLFEIQAKTAGPIKRYSAFQGEEEYLLAPGTKLHIDKVRSERGGLVRISMTELEEERMVS